jgi:hypothetical protein
MPGGAKRWTREVPNGIPAVADLNFTQGNRRGGSAYYSFTATNIKQDVETDLGRLVPPEGGGVLLNGTSSAVDETAGENYQMVFGTNDYTIDAWINPAITAGNQYFLSLGTSFFFTTGTYDKAFNLVVYTPIATLSATGYPMKANTWHHVAVTRSGDVHRLFLNGAQVATQTVSGSSGSPTGVAIGHYSTSYYQGQVGAIRVINGKALWTANFNRPRRKVKAPIPQGCAVYYNWDLNDAGAAFYYMEPTNSMATSGSSEPACQYWKFTGSHYTGVADPVLHLTAGGYLTVNADMAHNLGSGDFTIDFWLISYTALTITKWGAAGSRCWSLTLMPSNQAAACIFYYTTDGTNSQNVYRPGIDVSPHRWVHMAIVRTGNVMRMFQDGVQLGADQAFSSTIFNTSQTIQIGDGYNYVSHLRTTVGQALWTGTSFTPPTRTEYPVTSYTKMLMKFDQDFGIGGNLTFPYDDVPKAITVVGGSAVKNRHNGPFTSYTLRGATAFTIEAFIFATGVSTQATIAAVWDATYGTSWQWYLTSSRYMVFDAAGTTFTSTRQLSFNRWYHVAVIRDGSNWAITIDGIPETFTGSPTIPHSFSPLTIGWRADLTYPFLGKIAKMRIALGTVRASTTFGVPTRVLHKNANVIYSDDGAQFAVIDNPGALLLGVYSSSDSGFADVGTGNFTIDAWIKHERQTTGTRGTFICRRNLDYTFYVDQSGRLTFATGGTSTPRLISVDNSVPSHRWCHVAVVRTGTGAGQTKLYINGVEPAYTSTEAINVNYSNAGAYLEVGGPRSSVGTYSWYGKVCKFRFSNAALWTATFTPPKFLRDYVLGSSTKAFLTGSLFSLRAANLYPVTPGYYPYVWNTDSGIGTVEGGFTNEGFPLLHSTTSGLQRFYNRSPALRSSTGDTTRYQRLYRAVRGAWTALTAGPTGQGMWISQYAWEFNAGTLKAISVLEPSNVYTPSIDPTPFYFDTGEFTIQFWLQTSSSTYPKHLLNSGTDDNTYRFRLSLTAANQLTWNAKNSGATEHSIVASKAGTNLNDSAWHHIAIVRASTTTTVYIDGTNAGSETSSTPYRTSGVYLYYGNLDTSNVNQWVGYLSDLEVIKGRALWTANFTPSTSKRDYCHGDAVLALTPALSAAVGGSKTVVAKDVGPLKLSLSGFVMVTGVSSSMSMPSPVRSVSFGTSDFTIDFWQRWCNAGSLSVETDLFNYCNSVSWGANYPSGSIRIYLNTGAQYCFSVYDGTTRYTQTGGGYVSAQTWHHIALVRSGTTIKLFVNGTETLSQTVAANYAIRDTGQFCYCAQNYAVAPLPTNPPSYLENIRLFVGKALWTGTFAPPRDLITYRRQYNDYCAFWLRGSRQVTTEGQDRWEFNSPVGMVGTALSNSSWGTKSNFIMPVSPRERAFTIEFWVYFESRSTIGTRCIISGMDGVGSDSKGFEIRQDTAGVVTFYWYLFDNYENPTTFSTPAIPNEEWHHIVFQRSAYDIVTTYVDGIITARTGVGAGTIMTNPGASLRLFNGSTAASMAGCISNFQFHVGVAKYNNTGFVPDPNEPRRPEKIQRF